MSARRSKLSLAHQKGAEPLSYDDGWYTIADAPTTLVRMGLCRWDDDGIAQAAAGSHGMLSRRMGGSVLVRVRATRMLAVDQRFRAAIARVLSGAPCADFELPGPETEAPGA